MTEKELIETLRNFTEKQVNDLPDKAKIVFYAIMNIADQRDELKGKINKALQFIKENKWNSSYEDDYDIYLCEEEINQLQKILKGEIK